MIAFSLITVGLLYFRQNITPAPHATIKNDIYDFPIYPGSTYLKSEPVVCPSPFMQYQECGSIAYILETTQLIDRVEAWYKENTVKDGWQHKGGAGLQGSYITDVYEKNDGTKINLKLATYGSEKSVFNTKIYITPLIR